LRPVRTGRNAHKAFCGSDGGPAPVNMLATVAVMRPFARGQHDDRGDKDRHQHQCQPRQAEQQPDEAGPGAEPERGVPDFYRP